MKYLWILGALLLVIIWLFFPAIFNWWAEFAWHIPHEQVKKIADLGPLGDIYGSLNTLISSIALCAVAFSTWLQVTSLSETRVANKKQLDFAEMAHNAQISETISTLFSSKFYSLLSFKNERLNQIKLHVLIEDKEIQVDGLGALRKIAAIYLVEMNRIGSEIVNYEYKQLLEHFTKKMAENFSDRVNPIISYYYIYGDLIKLINESEITLKEKEFYKSILRNSMLQEEQIVFFWLAAIFKELNKSLENSEIFNQFHNQRYVEFALKFHKKSHFKSESWKAVFEVCDS